MIRGAICLALLAGATTARAQESADFARLIAAIEDAGCVVHDDNEKDVLAASGLTEGQAAAIVLTMMQDGRAIPQNDDLRLMTGKCH